VRGQPWRDRLDREGQGRAQVLSQQYGYPDLLARVLAGRGVDGPAAALYLDPTVRALMPDPDVLRDMGTAVERLARAAETGETVAIFGDYDVDGACSSALLAGFLEACGARPLVHIPDRVFEGYGPNAAAIRGLAERGARLLVTVDCGTTSHDALAEATRLGMDTVVFDHHQAPAELPAVLALVNPNRQDDLSGLGQLCATGVVFMALVALNRRLRQRNFWSGARPEPDLLAHLDLVALATVADVVPLTGLNRAFVAKGLGVMRARGRPGLRALLDLCGDAGPPTPFTLGFLLGPRINAGGRIGDAALGARLLNMADEIEAGRIAGELDRLNRERRAIELAAVAEAEALASLDAGDAAILAIGSETWLPGVVGLVASRLKDRFKTPAFAIAFNGEIGTGSGRSLLGADLGRAVRRAVEDGLLIKGGGHAMAAGITIERGKLAAFRAFMEAELGDGVRAARRDEALHVDASVTAGAARADLVAGLEKAGPFGSGNPEPIFVLPRHRLVDAAPAGEGHLRLKIVAGDGARLEGIAFRVKGTPLGDALLAARGGPPVHLAGTLGVDRWGGGERVKLRLLDLAPV
jgi:single-stranded-DNA-specific exonuclease